MLFNWILQGFNSTLTDIDILNITQFILKYITKEADVLTLMRLLTDSLNEIYTFSMDDSHDINKIDVQKYRKSILKKAATLSKILASLQKYYLKNADFVASLLEISTRLFRAHLGSKIVFVAPEQEPAKLKPADSIESTAQKPESEIFQDVIENLVAIITAGYSVYLLSCSSEVTTQIKLLNQEESKQPNTASGGEKREATNSNFDPLCTDYFRGIDALAGAEG